MTERVTEYFDVLIVGAGISGIGGAYNPTKQSFSNTANNIATEANTSYNLRS